MWKIGKIPITSFLVPFRQWIRSESSNTYYSNSLRKETHENIPIFTNIKEFDFFLRQSNDEKSKLK